MGGLSYINYVLYAEVSQTLANEILIIQARWVSYPHFTGE